MGRIMAKLRLPTQVFLPLVIVVSVTACSGATLPPTVPLAPTATATPTPTQTLNGKHVRVDARVRHVEPIAGQGPGDSYQSYQIGFEFLEIPGTFTGSSSNNI